MLWDIDLNLEKSLALFLPEAFFDEIITCFCTSLLRSNVEIRQMDSNGEKSCPWGKKCHRHSQFSWWWWIAKRHSQMQLIQIRWSNQLFVFLLQMVKVYALESRNIYNMNWDANNVERNIQKQLGRETRCNGERNIKRRNFLRDIWSSSLCAMSMFR